MHRAPFLTAVLTLTFSAALSGRATAQCPEWTPEFTARGVDGVVHALFAHDDGSGERLYVGGEFTAVGDVPARNVAVWDGASWSAIGDGVPGPVRALAVYDDGSGSALYAGGGNGYPGVLARYDGSSWTSIQVNWTVYALEVHDDGGGDALFVGGAFTYVDGIQIYGLGRYDGAWTALGSSGTGSNGLVYALESHDDGSGSKLYAAGQVTSPDDASIAGILSWDGATIAPVGPSGIPTSLYGTEAAYALQSFDGDLYVGGYFDEAGGLACQNWARWTPNGWEALPATEPVRDFGVRTESDGSRTLFLAGDGVKRWDVGGLTTVGSTYYPYAIEAFDEGPGERLFVGHLGGPNSLLRWEAGGWAAVLPDGAGLSGSIGTLASGDLGAGPRLFAGGRFTLPGEVAREAVASFDGDSWTSLSTGLYATTVYDVEVHDDGSGPALYAAGYDLEVDGVHALLARFNGTVWESLSSDGGSFDRGHVLATYAGELFMGGSFSGVGGIANTRYLARWDGTGWASVGGGLENDGGYSRVEKMALYDDGDGEGLYVAGRFALNGETETIARWDGYFWRLLGEGLANQSGFLVVLDVDVYQSPQGELLVAAGSFDTAGGAPAAGIAAWNGTSWSTFDGGPAGNELQARAVAAFDPDGNGERLYVSTYEPAMGSTPSRYRLDVWDGTSWAAPITVDEPFDGFVEHDDPDGRSLCAFGPFTLVDGVPSTGIARLSDPCGAAVGVPTCTALENSAGLHPRMRAAGSASIAADDLTLSARDLPPGASTLFFHGATPRRTPFGEGLRCAGGATQRIYPVGQATGGTYELPLDFAAPYAADFTAGATLLFQGWYRDAMGGPSGFNTTDALRIAFRP